MGDTSVYTFIDSPKARDHIRARVQEIKKDISRSGKDAKIESIARTMI